MPDLHALALPADAATLLGTTDAARHAHDAAAWAATVHAMRAIGMTASGAADVAMALGVVYHLMQLHFEPLASASGDEGARVGAGATAQGARSAASLGALSKLLGVASDDVQAVQLGGSALRSAERDSAPAASLDRRKARAAPTRTSEQPEPA